MGMIIALKVIIKEIDRLLNIFSISDITGAQVTKHIKHTTIMLTSKI